MAALGYEPAITAEEGRLSLPSPARRLYLQLVHEARKVFGGELLLRVLHLDIPTAVSQLERIFPATTDTAVTGDFGERATYVSDESQNYQRENEDIFKPMSGLYELMRRVSIGVVHRIGFFG